jgi:hypothetical protein
VTILFGNFFKSFLDHVGGHGFFFPWENGGFSPQKNSLLPLSCYLQAPAVSNPNVTKLIPFLLIFVLKKQDCYNKIFLLKNKSQTRETCKRKKTLVRRSLGHHW